jgi:hypothetical protein
MGGRGRDPLDLLPGWAGARVWPAAMRAGRGRATLPQRDTARFERLPGKHFLQEDFAPAIADLIAALAATASGPPGSGTPV